MDTKRWSLIAAAGLVALALGGCTSPGASAPAIEAAAASPEPTATPTVTDRRRYGSLLPGEEAPEFVGTQEWFNTEPVTLQGLLDAGQVVLVDFWTYSCFNCQNTQPYLSEWHETYGDEGLTIVGVHTPEVSYEEDAENVREAILAAGIQYPVVQDNDRATWRAFDNHVWPAMYLVGADGQIVYRHFGEGRYEETERAIREAIASVGG